MSCLFWGSIVSFLSKILTIKKLFKRNETYLSQLSFVTHLTLFSKIFKKIFYTANIKNSRKLRSSHNDLVNAKVWSRYPNFVVFYFLLNLAAIFYDSIK